MVWLRCNAGEERLKKKPGVSAGEVFPSLPSHPPRFPVSFLLRFSSRIGKLGGILQGLLLKEALGIVVGASGLGLLGVVVEHSGKRTMGKRGVLNAAGLHGMTRGEAPIKSLPMLGNLVMLPRKMEFGKGGWERCIVHRVGDS